MAKRKKGIIITSTCALLAGAAVIAELALGGGTGGNGVGRQQGWQNLQKEIFDSAYSEESYDSAVEVPEYEGEPYVILDGNEPAFTEDEMTTTFMSSTVLWTATGDVRRQKRAWEKN